MTDDMARILGSLIKRIGNYDAMETFDGRLKLQKTIYLMQSFDLYVGYDFGWYIRGPYSSSLTKDGYALRDKYDSVSEGKFADPEAEKRFIQFQEFIKGHENDSRWLEIVASIHFLKTMRSELPKESILQIVKDKQEYFTLDECKDAWNYLEKWGLIN